MSETKDKAPSEPKKVAHKAPVKRKPAAKKVHPDDAHKGNLTRSAPPQAPKDTALEKFKAAAAEHAKRTWAHNRTEIHREVLTVDDKKVVEVHVTDGRLYLKTNGEAVLDRDGVIDLQRQIAAAFQAVS